ncbi:4-alpha-glucanotransferase [Pectinatus frisingensis]|uniref:4-alpha-glucanotransferase n=1 Tax=Pectinatus frisingensis TaxID=865 RepID=UPI003D8015BA
MSEKNLVRHDSHSPYYRLPLGACPTDKTIYLAVDVVTEEPPVSVVLRLWRNKEGEQLIPLKQTPRDSNHYFVEITAPDRGCLIWYYFVITTQDKILYYGNNQENMGGIGQLYSQQPPSFQVTVYHYDVGTPAWFRQAIIYQIFPDRFYRHGNTLIARKNAVYHADWHDVPCYYKDADSGKIISYDFFGGNLKGIIDKLPYLQKLGISVIYLNPVFESSSNHHYDTGNYHKIDPTLGTNEDFKVLCAAAQDNNIKIILDGVFSHTGSDSIYFNREGNYHSLGAFQSKYSPYYGWYRFTDYPDKYDSWWGFETLPNVTETTPSYMDFILNEKNGVIRHWMENGASGWRLDVIDELPQQFSRSLYAAVKKIDADAVVIGEVWEDASNKISYDVSREYLCGYDMDAAMNYPFRTIVIEFLLNRISVQKTEALLNSQKENYPIQNYYAMMNLLGSHDVERIITILGEAPSADNMTAMAQAHYRLDAEHYKLGQQRSMLAALWQFTFPGVPSIYYGDEIGMQGFRDPHNRAPYDWDNPDRIMQKWLEQLIKLRNNYPALQAGELLFLHVSDDILAYARRIRDKQDVFGQPCADDIFVIIINRSNEIVPIQLDLNGLCHDRLENMLDPENKVVLNNNVLSMNVGKLSGNVLRQIHITDKYRHSCGILLHPTSLYTPYGIGDFGQSAYEFVDWLQSAGQEYWQILPLNPTGYGESPYQTSSVFAGNPLLISLDKLVVEGLLINFDINAVFTVENRDISITKMAKEKLLRQAFKNFSPTPAYEQFCDEQKYWLDDYALYSALKKYYKNTAWIKWPDDIKQYNTVAVQQAFEVHISEINYIKFIQYLFFTQWLQLKHYANVRGIKIIGDLPIFPSHDCADVWAHQDLFNLNIDGTAATIAGVPPDYFSINGQLWGNPHYRWDVMADDGYTWWVQRFYTLEQLVDAVRIDHFRGFAAYWAIDGKAVTAKTGKWIKGPGRSFFEAIKKRLGNIPIIAEDLGIITTDVEKLKNECGFPGMKVLQFELCPDGRKNIGFSCSENTVIYTGTHDNDTTLGWLRNTLSPEQKAVLAEYLKLYRPDDKKICCKLMEYAYASAARLAILPLQDVLGLDSSARMNTPGTLNKNWAWQLEKNQLTVERASFLAQLCHKYDR